MCLEKEELFIFIIVVITDEETKRELKFICDLNTCFFSQIPSVSTHSFCHSQIEYNNSNPTSVDNPFSPNL